GGGDGRCQGDGVVGVPDALGLAEHGNLDHHPAPEEDPAGTAQVRAAGPPGEPEPCHQTDERKGDEPGDLAADDVVEHAQPARRATEATPTGPSASGPGTSGAEDPGEAVVAEDEVQLGVVGAPAHVGP